MEKIGASAYCLDLLPHYQIHLVFNEDLPKKAHLDDQYITPLIPNVINGELNYKVESILGKRHC